MSWPIDDLFIPHLETWREVVLKRLLPTFSTISDDANTAQENFWSAAARAAGPDVDACDVAEAAWEAGYERFSRLDDTRQSLVNLFAVGLHHLFEQQCMFILRTKLIDHRDKYPTISSSEFVARLRRYGINAEQIQGWALTEELRDLANTVKHTDGRACESLKKRRPDLFTPPEAPDEIGSVPRHEVYSPLTGEDIYVQEADLEKYFDAIRGFWSSIKQPLEQNGLF